MLPFLLLFPLLVFSKTLNVPFVKQRDDFCGPASLSAVLAYYGINIPQEIIGDKVYNPKLKGALITDLEDYAKSFGLRAEAKKGNLEELKKLIDQEIPPIILVDLGRFFVSLPHYMVVVGYQGDSFVLHTGYEEGKVIKAKELNKIWERMGRVMLVVYPP
ncbi:MAG: cysteine peptidase family C39 domain-containing protein [Aquificaceae bacterium]